MIGDVQLYCKPAELPASVLGSGVGQESQKRHWRVGGRGGMTPPTACKIDPAANQPLGLLLHCRALPALKKKVLKS